MHYQHLVAERKACRICVDGSPGKICHAGSGPGNDWPADPDVVSHWSQRLGSKSPRMVVVGNDFNDWESYRATMGAVYRGTNDNLDRLLICAGITVDKHASNEDAAPVYLTNSILCLKSPKGAVRRAWVRKCTQRHLVPLLKFLRPPVVVGMGGFGWLAVRQAFRVTSAPSRLADAAGSYWQTDAGNTVFAVGHCSSLGLVSRGWNQQEQDWHRIGEFLKYRRTTHQASSRNG